MENKSSLTQIKVFSGTPKAVEHELNSFIIAVKLKTDDIKDIHYELEHRWRREPLLVAIIEYLIKNPAG